MAFFIVLGVLVVVGVLGWLVSRPTYGSNGLDPRSKRYPGDLEMRGDGGHHKEDFGYGGDKAGWE